MVKKIEVTKIMANYPDRQRKMHDRKRRVRSRRKIRKTQICANKLAKARVKNNDAAETILVIPILQTKNVENAIIKAWNEKEGKTLQKGDMIEITGVNSKIRIIEVSDDTIIYELDRKKRFFDLKGFRKFITKFKLSIHPIPILTIKIPA